MALNKAKIITVTSAKGGVGKTTTILNLAGILSEKKKKTIILDLDLYTGTVASSLNLNKGTDIYTLCDDMVNNRFKYIEDYIQKYNDYISVLASPLDPRDVGKIKNTYIENIISRLKLVYDYILIDTNHIINNLNLTIFDQSDLLLYVMTNDLADIKNMKTMISIFKDMNLSKYKIILNQARPNNTSYSIYEIRNIIGTSIDYVLPKNFYNKNIEKYVYNGKIMTLDKNIMTTKGALILNQIIDFIIKE